jgi:DNA-binding IscR family transcriptional regulator
VEPTLTALSRAGILIAAGGQGGNAGWVPARPPEAVSLAELLHTLRSDDAGSDEALRPPARADAVIEEAEQAAAAALDGRTMADLTADPAPQGGAALHRIGQAGTPAE